MGHLSTTAWMLCSSFSVGITTASFKRVADGSALVLHLISAGALLREVTALEVVWCMGKVHTVAVVAVWEVPVVPRGGCATAWHNKLSCTQGQQGTDKALFIDFVGTCAALWPSNPGFAISCC